MVENKFPERLKSLRKRRRVSQTALSELCGLSPNMVGLYETGKIQPTLGSLICLADHFGVSLDFLVGKEEG